MIPKDQCILRHVYALDSRNLSFGVWTGKSFIGIRHKMGSTYLASEYHAGEDHPFATAAPHKDVAVVPDDILLVECVDIPWTQVPGAKEGQRFSGTYEPLFKFMEVIEEKFRESEEDYYKRIKANDVQRD